MSTKSQVFVSSSGRLLFWKFVEGSPAAVVVDGDRYHKSEDKLGTVYVKEGDRNE